jgi:hypothetical protein
MAEDTKELAAAMSGLRADFAALKAVFEKEFARATAFEKWTKNILIAVVLSAGGVIWSAAVLSNEVKHLGVRVDRIEGGLDKTEVRLDKIEVRLDKIDVRLDKIEVRLDQLGSKVDQQTTSLNQQLGLILQRLDQVVPKKGGLS